MRRINTKIVIDIGTDKVLHRESFLYDGPLALAVAATAITQLGFSNMLGGRLEVYKFTLDPGSIAAGAQEVDTIAVTGAKAGDPCWVSFEAPDANVLPVGAKVTADNVVSVYIDNNITVTTAVDGAAMTGYLMILKRAI